MLIIPIEKKPDWRHPPIMCVALVIFNILIFSLYQRGDDQRWHNTLIQYEAHQLISLERHLYSQFLQQFDGNKPGREVFPDSQQLNDIDDNALAEIILFDRDFDTFVREYWDDLKQQKENQYGSEAPRFETLSQWQLQRPRIEAMRNQDSSFRFGVTPAELKPHTLITSQFMHGSWDHVLGNMLFLCLFGITLELTLGARVSPKPRISMIAKPYLVTTAAENRPSKIISGQPAPTIQWHRKATGKMTANTFNCRG